MRIILGLLILIPGALHAQDIVLKGGTVLTITNGVIDNGIVVIRSGKIAALGKDAAVPQGVEVVDVSGLYVMPGIVDAHTHLALSDPNERTDPVTPQVRMDGGIDPRSDSFLRTLAGGVTTVKIMHGSINVIGGLCVTLKLKVGRSLDEMMLPGVRQQLKLALGENPTGYYGSRGLHPSTRMGCADIMRRAFMEGRKYKADWDLYEQEKREGKENIIPPKRDQKLETLKMALEKKIAVDCHVYRAYEIVWIIRFCEEFGLDLKQLSHCVDGYKVADVIAASGVSFGGWVDQWWGKNELADGCPYGLKIMRDAGVNIVINSDDDIVGRYLNLEAAKAMKYNDLSEDDALKMITINAAKVLDMDYRIGSLEIGKDGDIAVFDKHPLDSTAKCVTTIIEGKVYFNYGKETIAKGGHHE
jgi:imidazolonepropionase-like amidohydrolase